MTTQSDQTPLASEEDLEKILGGESGNRFDAWWGLVIGTILLIVVMVILWPDPYGRILIYVIDGIQITLFITTTSFFFTLILGLIGGLGRLSKNRLIYGIATLYVEIIRGIPLLVQLIWWYFAFPAVIQSIGRIYHIQFLENYEANANAMAVMGLTICYGAYMSEIYRAGIQSIPKGQMEAAKSLGMNYFQAMRFIILPQAIRIILPPVGNEFIALLKDSSLVSVVAVTDLTKRGREFMSTHFNPIEVWSLVALIYLVMTLFAARVVNRIEKTTSSSSR